MSANDKLWDASEVSNLFKIKYDRLLEDLYNNENTTLGKLHKEDSLLGSQVEQAINFGFAGGVGSGSIPEANSRSVQKATITRKKVYAKGVVDREAIKAAAKAPDVGAFVKFTEEPAKATVESFMRNLSRILFGNSDGSLGTIATGGVSGTNPYTLTLSNMKEANFEESDYVNFGTDTDVFEITAVTSTTITVSRLSGTYTPVQGDVIYMQGSKDNDPAGLKGVLDATSGTQYGITVSRRWQAYQKAAASAGIDYDLLIEAALEIRRKTGKSPDLIALSFTQFRKLMIAMEDQKSLLIPPTVKEINGVMGFTNLKIILDGKPVDIIPERFVEDDRAYLLNTDKKALRLMMAPDSMGFIDDFGGSIFHSEHINGSDQYSIYYTMYGNFYIVPTFHGVITGLSTS